MMFTVLGATGFIGGHLVRSLEKAGHEVHAPRRGDNGIFTRPLGHVFYCVGLTADFRTRPIETMEAHVSFLASVLRRAEFTSLTYLSTTRLYSGAESAGPDARFLVDPHDPSDLYNLSKLAGEALCYSQGPAVRVARLSNVLGPGLAENFIGSLVRDALAGKIILRSHEDSAKDYISVEDVVELLPRIALSGKHRTYNIAAGRNIRHREWLDRLQEMTGCQVETDPAAPLLSFPEIDIDALRDEFQFSPRPVVGILSELTNPDPESP